MKTYRNFLILILFTLTILCPNAEAYFFTPDTCFDAINIDSFLDCPEVDNTIYVDTDSIVQEPFDWSLIPQNDLSCMDTSNGIWLYFTALNNNIVIRDVLQNGAWAALYPIDNCTVLPRRFCHPLPIFDIDDQVGHNQLNPGSPYLLYVFHQDSLETSIEICVDNNRQCDVPILFSPSYCQTVPICGLSSLDNYCFQMATNENDEGWPGCSTFLHDPNWFSFVAGTSNATLGIRASNCLTGAGIQFEVYSLPFVDSFGMNQSFCPAAELDTPLLGCIYSEFPLSADMDVFIQVPTQVGHTYGIVVDGWAGDLCDVHIEVFSGGGFIDVSGLTPPPPLFTDSVFPFISDTVCVGSEDIQFFAQELLGIDIYNWTINGQDVVAGQNASSVLLDFLNPGNYEICIQVDNYCTHSELSCIEVVAVSLDTLVIDTTVTAGSVIADNVIYQDTIIVLPRDPLVTCQGFIQLNVDIISSVSNIPQSNVHLYPTLTSDVVLITANEKIKNITIIGLNGGVYKTIAINHNKTELSFVALPDGIYALQVEMMTSTAIRKVIKVSQ